MTEMTELESEFVDGMGSFLASVLLGLAGVLIGGWGIARRDMRS